LEFSKSEPISGVISDQLDTAVTSVAYIAEKLNLPGIGFECSQYFTNKFLMRKKCKEIEIPFPEFEKVDSLINGLRAVNAIGFPVVIKPVDSSGSRGVFRIDGEEEFEEKFWLAKNESSSGKVIIEKYIIGAEYFAAGFVDEYKPRLFAFANRNYFNLEKLFIPNMTIFPANVEAGVQKRLEDYHNRLIEKLKPRFGLTSSEWIYNRETDTVYLVEIAIRGGGVFISSDLIPRAYNFDSQAYLINASLNQKNEDIFKADRLNRSSAYICFLLPEGKVSRVSGLDKLKNINGVDKSFVNKIEIGEITKPVTSKGSRLGPILISGNTRKEVERTIKEIRNTVLIEVETSCGRSGVIWE